MFISYYKLSIAFDDFGKQGKAAAKNRRKKIKKGMFIGAFLAVSVKGFVYYQKPPDFINDYSYSHILSRLLDSWDGTNSKYQVFLSHQIEGSSTALKAIQGRRHQASVYPAGHTDVHLADVVFFNMGSTLQERHLQAFNDLYLGVLDHNFFFGCQMMADLFVQMVFHVNIGNQSRKNKHLPPWATATYQPIQPMTNEEYNKCYMVAIMKNTPASTPATNTPNPQAQPTQSQTPRSAPPLHLPSCVILPPSVNSLPPLALDQTVFPHCTKKGAKITAKPLNSLGDLAHTVDERFILAYPEDPPVLAAPAWEETLVNLDYLLAWCCPLLKIIRTAQSNDVTSRARNSN
ncbi:hypothetical protein DSO57_1005777 [Entomophthora muscae]|uniref:Uncharacterized protein n=1 Tax=Entomophthora muscae TaxID=34485 RepID=A0ACC2SWR9_9FUNG|nr:hypothetical protein DSO57_1005777 [Entomophthora muscae]